MLFVEIEQVAKLCHQANKAICETWGDNSQRDWEDAEQWQRDSAINGVKFRLDNPAATGKDQHDAWVADKLADGWVFGEIKDPVAKTHPCMVEYCQLPKHQQVKDGVFSAIVQAALVV
jgi:hypothetical protein